VVIDLVDMRKLKLGGWGEVVGCLQQYLPEATVKIQTQGVSIKQRDGQQM
jgi:hypothetical protein